MQGKHLSKHCQNAYSMGCKAFYNGRLDSPFKQSTLMHKEFMRGFNASYIKQQKRISNHADN
jgi:hypothetical protein